MKPTEITGPLVGGRIVNVPSRSLTDRRLRGHHRELLQWFCYLDSQSPGGWFQLSHRRLGQLVGRNRTTVATTTSELRDFGYIQTRHQSDTDGRQLPNLYRIVYDPPDSDSPVGQADTPGNGMSATPTHQMHGVGGANGGTVGVANTFLKTHEVLKDLKSDAATEQLVEDFLGIHRRIFPLGRQPSPDRLRKQAQKFADAGLPSALAQRVIETVFVRLRDAGSTHVTSMRVIERTWAYVAARWRADPSGAADGLALPQEPDDLGKQWSTFQDAYPRAEGLLATATRKLFFEAAREAGNAAALVEAARTYARRMSDREERWLKTAERWLRDGHWREYIAQDVSDDHGAGHPMPANSRPADTGTVSGDATAWWPAVMAGLSNRHGQALVEMWFKDLHVRGDLQGGVVITAPTRFLRDQIDHRFGTDLQSLIAQAAGQPLRVTIGNRCGDPLAQ